MGEEEEMSPPTKCVVDSYKGRPVIIENIFLFNITISFWLG